MHNIFIFTVSHAVPVEKYFTSLLHIFVLYEKLTETVDIFLFIDWIMLIFVEVFSHAPIIVALVFILHTLAFKSYLGSCEAAIIYITCPYRTTRGGPCRGTTSPWPSPSTTSSTSSSTSFQGMSRISRNI